MPAVAGLTGGGAGVMGPPAPRPARSGSSTATAAMAALSITAASGSGTGSGSGSGRGNGSSDNGITNGTTRQAGGSASSSGSGSGRAAVSGGSGGRGGGGTGAPGLSGTAGSSGIAPANDRVKLDTLLKSRAVKLTGTAKFEAWRKAIQEISKWRGWPTDLLAGEPSQWDGTVDRTREEAYLVLTVTIDESLRYLIESCEFGHVEAAWRALCGRFDKITTHQKGKSMKDFWGLSMESTGLPVDRFIALIQQEAKNLREKNKQILEEDMSSVLLMGLSPDFHVIATRLREENQDDFTYIAERVKNYAMDNNLQTKVVKGAKGKGAGDVVFAMGVCEAYLKGKCKYGDKCRYTHKAIDEEEAGNLTQKKKEKKCYNCGKSGHFAKACKAPKQKNKNAAKAQGENEEESSEENLVATVLSMESTTLAMIKAKTEDTKDLWGLDTCATEHLTNNEADFEPESVEEVNKNMLVGNSGLLKLIKKGSIKLKQGGGPMLTLKTAYLAPDLPRKLLSVGLLSKAGMSLTINDEAAEICKGKKKVFTGERSGNIFVIRAATISNTPAKGSKRNESDAFFLEKTGKSEVQGSMQVFGQAAIAGPLTRKNGSSSNSANEKEGSTAEVKLLKTEKKNFDSNDDEGDKGTHFDQLLEASSAKLQLQENFFEPCKIESEKVKDQQCLVNNRGPNIENEKLAEDSDDQRKPGSYLDQEKMIKKYFSTMKIENSTEELKIVEDKNEKGEDGPLKPNKLMENAKLSTRAMNSNKNRKENKRKNKFLIKRALNRENQSKIRNWKNQQNCEWLIQGEKKLENFDKRISNDIQSNFPETFEAKLTQSEFQSTPRVEEMQVLQEKAMQSKFGDRKEKQKLLTKKAEDMPRHANQRKQEDMQEMTCADKTSTSISTCEIDVKSQFQIVEDTSAQEIKEGVDVYAEDEANDRQRSNSKMLVEEMAIKAVQQDLPWETLDSRNEGDWTQARNEFEACDKRENQETSQAVADDQQGDEHRAQAQQSKAAETTAAVQLQSGLQSVKTFGSHEYWTQARAEVQDEEKRGRSKNAASKSQDDDYFDKSTSDHDGKGSRGTKFGKLDCQETSISMNVEERIQSKVRDEDRCDEEDYRGKPNAQQRASTKNLSTDKSRRQDEDGWKKAKEVEDARASRASRKRASQNRASRERASQARYRTKDATHIKKAARRQADTASRKTNGSFKDRTRAQDESNYEAASTTADDARTADVGSSQSADASTSCADNSDESTSEESASGQQAEETGADDFETSERPSGPGPPTSEVTVVSSHGDPNQDRLLKVTIEGVC